MTSEGRVFSCRCVPKPLPDQTHSPVCAYANRPDKEGRVPLPPEDHDARCECPACMVGWGDAPGRVLTTPMRNPWACPCGWKAKGDLRYESGWMEDAWRRHTRDCPSAVTAPARVLSPDENGDGADSDG